MERKGEATKHQLAESFKELMLKGSFDKITIRMITEQAGVIRLPVELPECRHNAHMFHILLKDLATRSALIEFLKKRDIHPVFHYVPLHSAPKGLELGGGRFRLPVTDDCAGRLLRLPCYYELQPEEVDSICELIRAFFR